MAAGDLIMAQVVDGQPFFPCGGCEPPPSECCLYPSVGYLDSSFVREDLLEQFIFTFVFDGDTYTVTMVKQSSGDTIYTGTEATFGDFTIKESEFSGDNWQINNASLGGWVSGCLISAAWENPSLPDLGESEDEFPDTLTVNGADPIARIDLCTWTGTKTGGGTWTLFYNSEIYKFTLNGVAKTDPQSSPVGDYGADTVS